MRCRGDKFIFGLIYEAILGDLEFSFVDVFRDVDTNGGHAVRKTVTVIGRGGFWFSWVCVDIFGISSQN